MANEVREFIRELRAGKTAAEAFWTYCQARLVVPVIPETAKRSRDPFLCSPVWGSTYADAAGADAFEAGKSDEEIAEAFKMGLRREREEGIVYRPMKPEERATSAQLIRAMDRESQLAAAEIFGVGAVAHAIMGGEFVRRDSGSRAERREP